MDMERLLREQRVIEEFGGILPYYEAFYIDAVLYLAGAARAAFTRFRAALSCSQENHAAVVGAVQEGLGHAAALSRFFWPSEKKKLAAARAKKLRLAFCMAESPLRNRALRNSLEHFDERLDEYLLADIFGIILPGPLVASHELADDNRGHVFRLVDPDALIFAVLGNKHAFGAVEIEVQRINSLAEIFASAGGRLQSGTSL